MSVTTVGRLSVVLFTVILSISGERSLLADASYKETTQITGGSLVGMMKLAGTFSSQARKANQPITTDIYVSGNRMARIRPDGAEIIDLDAGTITQIDSVKRQYTTTTFQQMRQQLEQAERDAEAKAKENKPGAQNSTEQPSQDVDVSFDVHVRQTGATKQVSGLDTKEAIMTMGMNTVDRPTQQKGTLGITNDMWLAERTPVYDEIREFNEKFAKEMGQVFSGSQGLQGMQSLMAQPGAAKGMTEMANEVQKLKGVPILQVMRMGVTTNGQPLPAASEQPLPPSTGPAMPTAGDVAQQTATSVAVSKLGGLGSALGGGFGGFGHKKKANNPPPEEPTNTSTAEHADDPKSAVLVESSTTLSDFSADPVAPSHFQIPAGYQQVTTPADQRSN